MHFDAGNALGVKLEQSRFFAHSRLDDVNLRCFCIVEAFCQRQQQGKLIDGGPVILSQHILVEAVLEIAFGNAVVPAGDSSGDKLLLVREAEELGVLNHIGTVARMAVEVDGDADIMQQCCCFEQAAIALAQAVQLLPAVEHRQGKMRDVTRVGGISFFVQLEHVLAAACQNIRCN